MPRLTTIMRVALATVAATLIASCSDARPPLSSPATVAGGSATHDAGPVASVAVVGLVSDIYVDQSASFDVTAHDNVGNPIVLNTGHTIRWSTSSSAVASLVATQDVVTNTAHGVSAGSATICATVDNIQGCASTTVHNRPPTITFTLNKPAAITSAGDYTWSVTGVTGGTGASYRYAWLDSTGLVGTSASYTRHVGYGAGTFKLTVAVASSDQPSTEVTETILVDASAIPAPPSLQVSISGPSSHKPNEACTFSASVTESGATSPAVNGTPPYTYSWSALGQSGSSQFFNPSSVGATGSYNVFLTVTDANGVVGSASKNVLVGTQFQQCPE